MLGGGSKGRALISVSDKSGLAELAKVHSNNQDTSCFSKAPLVNVFKSQTPRGKNNQTSRVSFLIPKLE